MIRTLTASAALLTLLLSAPAITRAAEPQSGEAPPTPWYQVELFIFAQRDDNLMAEFWDERVTPPALPDNALLLLEPNEDPLDSPRLRPATGAESAPPPRPTQSIPTPDALENALIDSATIASAPRPVDPALYQDNAYRQLDREQWSLPLTDQRLSNRGYRPLYHAAWRQPALERGDALPIIVTSDERLADGSPALSGLVTLSISRYLHLETELYYQFTTPPGWMSMRPKGADEQATTEPASAELPHTTQLPPADTDLTLVMPQPETLTLRMQQSRRMRSGELHYMDHPMLGLIVRVTPYDLPQPEPEPLLPAAEHPLQSPANEATNAAAIAPKDEKN